jgi:hypothetical protein
MWGLPSSSMVGIIDNFALFLIFCGLSTHTKKHTQTMACCHHNLHRSHCPCCRRRSPSPSSLPLPSSSLLPTTLFAVAIPFAALALSLFVGIAIHVAALALSLALFVAIIIPLAAFVLPSSLPLLLLLLLSPLPSSSPLPLLLPPFVVLGHIFGIVLLFFRG